MRLHNPAITGSLTVSGSSNVDFTSATGGVSGSFRASDIKSAIPANTVSASAQLSTAISGSFTEASSSFSIRIARNEGTGSSLTSDSGSFSTRVSNLKTDSGSFSTRITAATSSISALKTDSGSFSTKITTNTSTGSILAGSGNIQGLGSTNAVTFASVTATGNITAQEFHTEFVSSSIIHTSGSTKFGDTQDDIHQFTGSLQQSGSTGNHYFQTGNVGIGTTNPQSLLHISGSHPFIYVDRADDDERAGLTFLTNGAETNGAWSFRMNHGASSDTTPDLSVIKQTGTDVEMMSFAGDGGSVNLKADGIALTFGADSETSLTHIHNLSLIHI